MEIRQREGERERMLAMMTLAVTATKVIFYTKQSE